MKPLPQELQAMFWQIWANDVGDVWTDIDSLDKEVSIHVPHYTTSAWNGFQAFVTSHTKEMWQQVEPLFDDGEKRKLDSIFFAPVPAYDFNGIASVLPTGETVIGISVPIILLAHVDLRIHKAGELQRQVVPLLREGMIPDHTLMDKLEALFKELFHIRAIARIVTGISKNLAELPSDTIDELAKYDHVIQPTYAKQLFFVLLHELGHVCLDHVETATQLQVMSEDIGHPIALCQPSHHMELSADLFAVEKMRIKSSNINEALGIFFAFLRFLEDARELYASTGENDPPMRMPLRQGRTSASHPAARIRYKNLVNEAGLSEEWYGPVWELLQSRCRRQT